MSELKPCPLCGSEVGWVSGSIRCSRCGLSYRPPVSKAKEQVERRWNARAERTCRIVKSEFRGGMWVYCHEFSCGCGQRNLFTTSDKPPRYCPNCGARVEEDE